MCTYCITPFAKGLCDTPLVILHDLHPFLIYTPTPSVYIHPIFNSVIIDFLANQSFFPNMVTYFMQGSMHACMYACIHYIQTYVHTYEALSVPKFRRYSCGVLIIWKSFAAHLECDNSGGIPCIWNPVYEHLERVRSAIIIQAIYHLEPGLSTCGTR